MLGVILTIWAAYCFLLKKSSADLQGKILTSFIVVFYLIHPSITKGVFRIFNCVEIDGDLKV